MARLLDQYKNDIAKHGPVGSEGFCFDESTNVFGQGKAYSFVTFNILLSGFNDPSSSQVVGKADRQALDETGAVIRRRIDLLGIHDAKLRVGSRGRIVITARRALTSSQRRVLTQRLITRASSAMLARVQGHFGWANITSVSTTRRADPSASGAMNSQNGISMIGVWLSRLREIVTTEATHRMPNTTTPQSSIRSCSSQRGLGGTRN